MPERTNRKIYFVSRPEGMPNDENFKLREVTVPELKDGQVLVQTLYLSVDPYMRGRMRDVKSYVPPFELSEVLTGGVVGKVVESKHPDFSNEDIVLGHLGWQDYTIAKGKYLVKINPDAAPISTALGILGMPGMTAYFGLLDIGRPNEGETVVVSGAAGAVGSAVGQIAKLKGCRVVGTAGSERKIKYLKEELGFDAAINYKTTPDMKKALKEACPDGVDVYFDNVGGELSDTVIKLINDHARIIVCGQIALYNLEKADVGPRVQPHLIVKSALMKGFTVGDYKHRTQEAQTQLAQWYHEGKLKYEENVIEGLENAPQAFIGLFHGENLGKQIVKVAD
jgi:leukotriene B4 12-hydroxydehydrogenase/15-oxo-prostaglandin 13-reductase